MTVVTGKSLLEVILMRRGKATQTRAKLSEGSLEKAIVPDSKALVIISKLEYFTNVLEEIGPSLKAEFRAKYPSALPNDKVAILDGYNDPFKKIYWRNYPMKAEITDIILECFQMAENDQMNSIILQIHPHQAIEAIDLEQEIILGLQIFAKENPISGIRRLYNDTGFFRQEDPKDKKIGIKETKHAVDSSAKVSPTKVKEAEREIYDYPDLSKLDLRTVKKPTAHVSPQTKTSPDLKRSDKTFKELTVHELCERLKLCGFEKLIDICRNGNMDGKILHGLEEKYLAKSPFHLTEVQIRKFRDMVHKNWIPKLT